MATEFKMTTAVNGTERFLERMCEAGANLEDPRYASEVKALREAAEQVDVEWKKVQDGLEDARLDDSPQPVLNPNASAAELANALTEIIGRQNAAQMSTLLIMQAQMKFMHLEHALRVRERDLLAAVIGEMLRKPPVVT